MNTTTLSLPRVDIVPNKFSVFSGSRLDILMVSIKWLALALLPIWVFPAHAQVWKGILDSTRAIDWRATGAANVSESRTQCGSTLLPSGIDDTVAINSAIAACGQHQFVLLGLGTFIVSNGITFG